MKKKSSSNATLLCEIKRDEIEIEISMEKNWIFHFILIRIDYIVCYRECTIKHSKSKWVTIICSSWNDRGKSLPNGGK